MGNKSQKSASETGKTEPRQNNVFSSRSVTAASVVVSKGSVLSVANAFMGYEINREDVDSVMVSLREWEKSKIHAVWLCSRPITRVANGYFQHWCVKLHCGDTLLELDFFEKDKKGAFGLKARSTMFAELDEFLMYYVPKEKGRDEFKEERHTILAYLLPTLPLTDQSSDPNFMYQTPEKVSDGLANFLEKGEESGFVPAKCSEKTVADIITFLEKWSAEHQIYNAVTCNCQSYAKDLYEFLIGPHHKDQLENIIKQMQSFADFDREMEKLKLDQQNSSKDVTQPAGQE